MASVRTCARTGKHYTFHNIPLDFDYKELVTSVQNERGFFKILSENHSHPEDSWYEGKFIGDRYAVFKWVNTSPSQGFYQQITPWYQRFGYAVRMIKKVGYGDA